MVEDKYYFYFVLKFVQKNNLMFIVYVLLKFKYYVILFFFLKWLKNGIVFDVVQFEKIKYFFGLMLEKRI